MPVTFLPAARQDALRQYRYLAREAGLAIAGRFLDALELTISRMSRRPNVGSHVASRYPELAGIRALPVEGFELVRVYYVVHEQETRVIRVLHARRDVRKLLRRAQRR
jgi:plasmid stabilization system protein ParE